MFFVYATQDTTGMIRAFLRVNCRFQVYATQDTTGMIRALYIVIDYSKLKASHYFFVILFNLSKDSGGRSVVV